jgi:hypothetical protein
MIRLYKSFPGVSQGISWANLSFSKSDLCVAEDCGGFKSRFIWLTEYVNSWA